MTRTWRTFVVQVASDGAWTVWETHNADVAMSRNRWGDAGGSDDPSNAAAQAGFTIGERVRVATSTPETP